MVVGVQYSLTVRLAKVLSSLLLFSVDNGLVIDVMGLPADFDVVEDLLPFHSHSFN
jgi:hypothetical protein